MMQRSRPSGTRNIKTASTLAAILLSAMGLQAQVASGRLTGTVKDSTGAVIPNASVTIINNASQISQTVPSTSTGTYVFEAISPGTYTLDVVAQGFRQYKSVGVETHLQQTLTIDVALEAGSANQEVTVEAAAPLLQAEDASVGQTISGQQVNDLPLASRDWTNLGLLAAGTVVSGGGAAASGSGGTQSFSANGAPTLQNNFLLNGIDNNTEVYGGAQQGNSEVSNIPPPDAIEEFKVETGDFTAELGHSTGAVINAALKSGTNAIHGDIWEYLRNTLFNANPYFAVAGQPKLPYHENQFGATIGGPVRLPRLYNGKDKTFFFFDYQGTRISQTTPVTSSVPTLGMQNSGFTNLQDLFTLTGGTKTDALNRIFPQGAIFDPATTRNVAGLSIDPVTGLFNNQPTVITVRDPFYSGGSVSGIRNFTASQGLLNLLPANRIDPNAQKLLALYPAPTPGLPGLLNYINSSSSPTTINQYDVRIDENVSQKDFLFGVFSYNSTSYSIPNPLPGLADGQNYDSGTTISPRHSVVLGYTHAFTPTLTNDAHAGWSYFVDQIIPFQGSTADIPATYGIAGVPQFAGNGGLPPISLAGFTGLGVSGYIPTLTSVNVLDFIDNVTKVISSHTIKVGFELQDIRSTMTQPPAPKGNFNFSGQFSDIPNASSGYNGIADLLLIPSASTVGGTSNLGGVSSLTATNSSATKDQRYYTGIYGQDNWKVTPNLTLNLGLRWENVTPYQEVHGRQANLILNGGNGSAGTYYIPQQTCNLPRSAGFDTLLASSGIQIQCTSNNAVGDTPNLNFAPRLGFAFRATPSLAIRGGYGIAYGALNVIGYGPNIGLNYPFIYSTSLNAASSQVPLTLSTGQTATLENSLPSLNLQNAASFNSQGVSLNGRQYNFQTPYTETYNLSIQDQFRRNDSIQIAYVGTVGRHLDVQGTHNSPSAILPPDASIYDVTLPGHIPFPNLGANSGYETTNAESSYNSIQTTYQHQLSRGNSLLANYTYSKCMTDQNTFGSGVGGYRGQWLPGFGISHDYAPCNFDAAQVIHISGSVALPFGHDQAYLSHASKLVEALAGGWVTNFIFSYQTGSPFTIGCVVPTTSGLGCNANLVAGVNPYAGLHNKTQWLNPAAFVNPPVATVAGQSSLAPLGGPGQQVRGPGYDDLDMSLFKQFHLTEATKLEFRAEAFNLPNTPSFANPNNLNFSNSVGFSQITATRSTPRVLQFAVKIYY